MVDVTKKNFVLIFPELEKSILEADFIALDAEFTGLNTGSSNKYSLFDNEEQRFKKVLRGSLDSLIIQLGIAAFKYDDSSTAYRAKYWNLNAFPDSFGSLDFPFTCTGDSIKFLVRNNFDFNKCFYDGIPFLNDSEEKRLQNEIDASNFLHNLSPDEEDELQEIRFQLSDGFKNKMIIDCKFISPYIVHMEIRERHKCLWSKSLEKNPQQIEVFTVKPELREKLFIESNGIEGIKKDMMAKHVGLTEVIRLLRRAKKPIVGHNCLLDLAKLYHQFISPLSDSYSHFKEEIMKEFPLIFDTKFMMAALRKELVSHDLKDVSRLLMKSKLSFLYEQLNGNLWKYKIFFEPVIKMDSTLTEYQVNYHMAGYDAYVTGKLFLYIAHISYAVPFYKWSYPTPLKFSGHLAAVKKWKNKIFLARSPIPCLDLESDQLYKLPLLYVSIKDSLMTSKKLSNLFSHYGRVEVRSVLPGSFLLACQTDVTRKQILKDQCLNSLLQIVPYKIKAHSLPWIFAEGVFVISFGFAFGYSVYALYQR